MPQLIQNGDVLSGTSNDSANILYSEPDGSSKNVQDKIEELNNSLTNVRTYVGEDGKLHFVDATGADSALPFNKFDYKTVPIVSKSYSKSIGVTNGHTYIIAVKSFGALGSISGGTILKNYGYVRSKDYAYYDLVYVTMLAVKATSASISFGGEDDLSCIIGLDITNSI